VTERIVALARLSVHQPQRSESRDSIGSVAAALAEELPTSGQRTKVVAV
jgi:hypothetical protein